MTPTEKARAVFAADRYATELTGVEISAAGDGEATCRLRVDGRHRNARGVVMGGVLFTLADFCAAVAANMGAVDEGVPLPWVSLDSTIHFLAPAVGESLTAHCTALKRGRTTALFQTEIGNLDSGKRVAIAETTMVVGVRS